MRPPLSHIYEPGRTDTFEPPPVVNQMKQSQKNKRDRHPSLGNATHLFSKVYGLESRGTWKNRKKKDPRQSILWKWSKI